MKRKLMEKFYSIFGDNRNAKAYFAPGRVNLIGEHTDYNGGHVFPCALSIGTYAVARKREDNLLRFYSTNFKRLGIIECSLDNLAYNSADRWTNYPKGVIWTLKKKGYNVTTGMDILYHGNIPNGSGLSSSASIEILTGFVLKDMYNFSFDSIENALIGQFAENNFNKVNCGIMDQFAISMGKKNHAIFLDTANLDYDYVPITLENEQIVIMNTCKKRGLGESKYNERRAECEEALKELQSVINIENLGQLTEELFEKHKNAIKSPIRMKRAKHAVYENQRTIKAVTALKNNDIVQLGQLMNASHKSLKDDYEVTGIELDTLVAEAQKAPGVLGARMTGAGFGGCAVAIVHKNYIDSFKTQVGTAYKEKIGYPCEFYVVDTSDGPTIL